MALYHRATLEPTKDELIRAWVPTQPWGTGGPIEMIGAFRLDDPGGRVGMEHFLVRAGDAVLHVPLTYRDEPLAGAETALITEPEEEIARGRNDQRMNDPALQTPGSVTL